MEKNYISEEQLCGFREPDKEEFVKIQQYVNADMKSSGSFRETAKYFCIGAEAFLILELIGMEADYPVGEKTVLYVTAFVFAAFIFLLNRNNRNARLYLKKIQKGEFQVLDCEAYRVDLAVESVGDAVAYICTKNGQYCNRRFIVDYISAKEWTQKKEVSFLLMRADCGRQTIYELFSARKLERR